MVSSGGDSEWLRDGLGAAFESARSHLRALLGRPDLLTSEHWRKLKALAGPEWMRLGIDIRDYLSWAARAVELVQVIYSTPRSAVNDMEWTALLNAARRAVEEAHVAAGYAANAGSPGEWMIRTPEGPGGPI